MSIPTASLRFIPLAVVAALLFANPADAQFWKRDKDKKADKADKTEKSEKKSSDQRCEDIALEWMPDESYSDLDPVNLTGISSLPIEIGAFTDKRRQEDLREIGRNIEDADDSDEEDRKTLYVTTDDDIVEFVRHYTGEVLAELGYEIVGPGEGTVIITGDLRDFHTEEEGTYKAQTRIYFRVATKGGKMIYEAMHGESETTFGRSYKCENYLQVLSESLMETVHSLAVQDKFYYALENQTK